MWTVLKLSDSILLYRCTREKRNITFNVTDFKMVWHKTYSEDDFVAMFIADNPSLRGGNRVTIISMVLEKMEQDVEATMKSVIWDKGSGSLKCTFKGVGSITLKVNLSLEMGNAEMFYELFTLKLLTTINEMRKGQNELQSIIEQKDAEIQEYKNLGAILNIKYLITDKFDPAKYQSKYSEYDRNIKPFEEVLSTEIEMAQNNIKRRRTADAEEPNNSHNNTINNKHNELENVRKGSSSHPQGFRISNHVSEIMEENKQNIKKAASRHKVQKRKINF